MVAKGLSPGQRLLFIFIATIFVPGLLLALFGARALWQERQFAEQQIQGKLDDAAEIAARTLGDQLDRLQGLVDGGLPPEVVFQDFPSDGSWAFIEHLEDGIRVYPSRALPYTLTRAPIVWADNALAEATKLEAQQADVALIVAAYRNALEQPESSRTAEIKHRLALTLHKAGRTEEARRLWGEVQRAGGVIGALPAAFVASSELALMDARMADQFCGDLMSGRWRIEKVRFVHYLSEICHADTSWLPLAEALEEASSSSSRLYERGDGLYLAFRREKPSAVLVVGPQFLASQLWQRLPSSLGKDIEILRITVNGKELYSLPVPQSAPRSGVTRGLDREDLSWRVDVAPVDATGFRAAIARTTNVYIAILTGVVVLLGLGGYFIVRTILRELEVARMKSDFVSTVSHEFRSPLTGIRQLGEMLSRGRVTDQEKRQQYYDLIVHESDRLARLVENVLDFARMEDGRKQYSFEDLNTSEWLNSVAEEFQREAARTGHKLEASIPDRLPVVRGDREALSTALRNLLDNACKYSPRSETVWLNAEASNDGVRVHVRDRGVGIPEREQSQIFEKFYRGDGELSKQVKGAGLGLSLVSHIVTSHQGKVHVESREGEGSTFSIYLSGAA